MASIRQFAMALAGVAVMAAAAAIAALAPAIRWAREQEAIHAAAGHLPDMNPGMSVFITAFALAPFLLAACAVELARWLMRAKPLGAPAAALLGVLIGAPFGVRYLDPGLTFTRPEIAAWFVAVVALFHALRYRRLNSRRA